MNVFLTFYKTLFFFLTLPIYSSKNLGENREKELGENQNLISSLMLHCKRGSKTEYQSAGTRSKQLRSSYRSVTGWSMTQKMSPG